MPEGYAARVVFVSGHRFGVEALSGLMESEAFSRGSLNIAAVLCQHPMHAYSVVGYSDLYTFSCERSLNARCFHSLSSAPVGKFLSQTRHDYLLVVGLSQLVPPAILDLPKNFNHARSRHSESYGCIGMHPTILPVGRGRAPIPWSIIKSLHNSGVTAFLLEEEADSGGIIDQEFFQIDDLDHAGDVFEKVARCHRRIGQRLAEMLGNRALIAEPQMQCNATYWGRRQPRDGWLDFNLKSKELLRLIRACHSPYPGAFFVAGDAIFIVQDACEQDRKANISPGTILELNCDGSYAISTSDSAIRILKCSSGNMACLRVGQRIMSPNQISIDDEA
ncbi:MAG: glycoside formyltransferase [Proteobacteria bacterium]|nr:glycoside formyltransferase [Pseudomonadota bacterium]